MKLINNKAASVAEEWKRQYFDRRTGLWGHIVDGNSGDKYNQIVAAKGDRAKIEAIIGNVSWTLSWCSECKEHYDLAVRLDTGDYESDYCAGCIKKAMELLGI